MTGSIIAILALLVLLLSELRRRVPIWPLSPVWLIIGGYLVLAFAGRYGMRWSCAPWGQEFLFVIFSKTALDNTLLWLLFIITAFVLGALLSVWVSQRPDLPVEFPADVQREGGGAWLLIPFAALVLYIIGAGPENVLYRTVYLTGAGTVAKIAGGTLTPLAVGLCGYIALGFRSKLVVLGAVLAALGFFVVTFALATRLMALVPALFALGAFCAQPRSRIARFLFYGGMAVTPLLVPIPLALRNQAEQGLIPFISVLRAGMSLLRHQNTLGLVLSQVLMSFPLTTFVGQRAALGTSVLWTSVNPLPGRLTNWYQLAPTLIVSFSTPYNTLGMLMNYGALIGGGFYVAVGFYFSHVDWKIRRYLSRGRVAGSLVLFGFSALFLLLTTEYALRAPCRLIYYSAAFEILSGLFFPEASHGQQLSRLATAPPEPRTASL